jgi:Holliday junction endodeoxyribonuclease RuvC-like protein
MNFNEVIMTPTRQAFPLRLQLINEALSVIIARYHPQEAAEEKPFFGKNVMTVIGVAQARDVTLLTLVQSGLTIAEYTPGEVKLAVTGYGAVRKEQVGYTHELRNELVRRFSGRKGVYRTVSGLLEGPVHTRLIPASWLESRKGGGSVACRGQRPRKRKSSLL